MIFSCTVYLFLFVGLLQDRRVAAVQARQKEQQNQMYDHILFYIYLLVLFMMKLIWLTHEFYQLLALDWHAYNYSPTLFDVLVFTSIHILE